MLHYWLFLASTWFGTVSLQYITTGGPGADSIFEPLDPSVVYPLTYTSYFNLPAQRNDDTYYQSDSMNTDSYNQFYRNDDIEHSPDLQRKRRTARSEDTKEEQERRWLPNLIDTDKTMYIRNDDKITGNPFLVQGLTGLTENNASDVIDFNAINKKSFSPWGGKRAGNPIVEQMWTWKRAANIREPSMPKRVRFSPWGGKRNGQLIFKPGGKSSKMIFTSSGPDLTRIISNYSPSGDKLDLTGYQILPSMDKRHPFRILSLSTLDNRTPREAMPFNAFLDSLPRVFKAGHPYAEITLKKDGKRKVKFSAWGGKRSPPIIGPIWTPSSHNVKDNNLDAILIIRNSQDVGKVIKTM